MPWNFHENVRRELYGSIILDNFPLLNIKKNIYDKIFLKKIQSINWIIEFTSDSTLFKITIQSFIYIYEILVSTLRVIYLLIFLNASD